MRASAAPDDLCLFSVIQFQPTRRTPVLDGSNAPLHRLLGLVCFSSWSRYKQLLVFGDDVMLNMVCVEDCDDILTVIRFFLLTRNQQIILMLVVRNC